MQGEVDGDGGGTTVTAQRRDGPAAFQRRINIDKVKHRHFLNWFRREVKNSITVQGCHQVIFIRYASKLKPSSYVQRWIGPLSRSGCCKNRKRKLGREKKQIG
jgi:hypothetical protein